MYVPHRSFGMVRLSPDTKNETSIDLSALSWWLIWRQLTAGLAAHLDVVEERLAVPVFKDGLDEALHMFLLSAAGPGPRTSRAEAQAVGQLTSEIRVLRIETRLTLPLNRSVVCT